MEVNENFAVDFTERRISSEICMKSCEVRIKDKELWPWLLRAFGCLQTSTSYSSTRISAERSMHVQVFTLGGWIQISSFRKDTSPWYCKVKPQLICLIFQQVMWDWSPHWVSVAAWLWAGAWLCLMGMNARERKLVTAKQLWARPSTIYRIQIFPGIKWGMGQNLLAGGSLGEWDVWGAYFIH